MAVIAGIAPSIKETLGAIDKTIILIHLSTLYIDLVFDAEYGIEQHSEWKGT